MSDRERCPACGKSVFKTFTEANQMAEHMRRTIPEARRVVAYPSRECGGVYHVGERHYARDGKYRYTQMAGRGDEWQQ